MNKNNVFLSYSALDGREFVDAIQKKLLKAGYKVFADTDVFVGESIAVTTQNQLENASVIIVLLTSAAKDSEWVSREVGVALRNEKAIVIPILIDESAKESPMLSVLGDQRFLEAQNLEPEEVAKKVVFQLEKECGRSVLDAVMLKTKKSVAWLGIALGFAVIIVSGSILFKGNPKAADQIRLNGGALGASLVNQDFEKAEFESLDFSSTDFRSASLDFCNFSDSTIELVKFSDASLRFTVFYRAKGANADFSKLESENGFLFHANFTEAELVGANFSGTKLDNVNFTDANMQGANLKGCDLSTAVIRNTNLTDAEYDNETILPLGFDTIAHGMKKLD